MYLGLYLAASSCEIKNGESRTTPSRKERYLSAKSSRKRRSPAAIVASVGAASLVRLRNQLIQRAEGILKG
jgi:hypothetical protein